MPQDNKTQLQVEFTKEIIKEIIPPPHLPPRGHGLFNPQGERYPSSGIIQWLAEHVNIGASGGMSITADLFTRYLKTTEDLLIPPEFSRTGQALRIKGTGENLNISPMEGEIKVASTKTTPDSSTVPSLKKIQFNNKEKPFSFPPIPRTKKQLQNLIKEYELFAQGKRQLKIALSIPNREQTQQFLAKLREREFEFQLTTCTLADLKKISQENPQHPLPIQKAIDRLEELDKKRKLCKTQEDQERWAYGRFLEREGFLRKREAKQNEFLTLQTIQEMEHLRLFFPEQWVMSRREFFTRAAFVGAAIGATATPVGRFIGETTAEQLKKVQALQKKLSPPTASTQRDHQELEQPPHTKQEDRRDADKEDTDKEDAEKNIDSLQTNLFEFFTNDLRHTLINKRIEQSQIDQEYTKRIGGKEHLLMENINLCILGLDTGNHSNDPAFTNIKDGTGRADTILFVSINPRTLQFDMFSVPRDLSLAKPYVGTRVNQVTTAFYDTNKQGKQIQPDFDFEQKRLEELVGLPLDIMVKADTDSVINFVDKLFPNGIPIIIQKQLSIPGKILTPEKDIFGKPKPTYLRGEDLFNYLRVRKDPLDAQVSDYTRGPRAQEVMRAIIEHWINNFIQDFSKPTFSLDPKNPITLNTTLLEKTLITLQEQEKNGDFHFNTPILDYANYIYKNIVILFLQYLQRQDGDISSFASIIKLHTEAWKNRTFTSYAPQQTDYIESGKYPEDPFLLTLKQPNPPEEGQSVYNTYFFMRKKVHDTIFGKKEKVKDFGVG